MNRVGVGRMLVASLHQGISDLIPTRLEFYENWLNPKGMRDGKIGLAPLAAVLSFLRQEGDPYTLVTSRAGQYAAQWTFDSLTPLQRSFIRALPVMMRARMAMHLAKKVVRRSFTGSRGVTKLRKGRGSLTLRQFGFLHRSRAVRLAVVRVLFGRAVASLHARRRERRGARAQLSGRGRRGMCHRRQCAGGAEMIVLRAVFLVLVCAGAAFAQPSPRAARVLVIPFENPTKEARIYWLGEASAVLLADDLNALGTRAYTREERLHAFRQLQVPPVATLSHATVIRLGQVVGATHVAIGSFRLTGGQIAVRAQSIRLDNGSMEHEISESGALEDLFAVFERVSRRLAAVSATAAVTAKPALPVFENYIKGLIASATPAKISYLETAIKLDPGFRSGAPCAVERPLRRRERAACARHGGSGFGELAVLCTRAVQPCAVAAAAEPPRRRVCNDACHV